MTLFTSPFLDAPPILQSPQPNYGVIIFGGIAVMVVAVWLVYRWKARSRKELEKAIESDVNAQPKLKK